MGGRQPHVAAATVRSVWVVAPPRASCHVRRRLWSEGGRHAGGSRAGASGRQVGGVVGGAASPTRRCPQPPADSRRKTGGGPHDYRVCGRWGGAHAPNRAATGAGRGGKGPGSLPRSSTGEAGRAGFLTADAATILPLAQLCPTRRGAAVQWLVHRTTPLAVNRLSPALRIAGGSLRAAVARGCCAAQARETTG